MMNYESEVKKFMNGVKKRNPAQIEFHQAVQEVVSTVMPWYLDHSEYKKQRILERLTEPDRVISFRVSWVDDKGQVRVNRGWRVQFSNALGPYKGGLRFAPSVNESTLKFLGYEQIFKNSLTGLPMGGAKGGSNFNPKGKTNSEIMRFCQAFMTELHNYIGEDMDIPAGDIGVGAREISYLFGQYVRLENRWAGVMTGKGCSFGGSAIRKEATGYGAIYFCENILNEAGKSLNECSITISGSGNVALYAAQKAIEMKAKVLTMSDSSGFIYIKDGLTMEQLEKLIFLKEVQRERISKMTEYFKNIEFIHNARPWSVTCDIAIPCATQNEIDLDNAKVLVKNGVSAVVEGANMPVTTDATTLFKQKKVLHVPGKASNAGGVAVSGLEMSQNAIRVGWSAAKVDSELQKIMKEIHGKCIAYDNNKDYVDYHLGANISGFKKVADTLVSFGVI